MRVVTVEQMREIERRAETEYGLTSPMLMEHAGRSIAEALREHGGGSVADLNVLALVGPGNNGGDGRVMGRYLAEDGARLTEYLWKENVVTSDVGTYPAGESLDVLREAVAQADVVADAFLGTGSSRPLDPRMRAALDLVREERARRPLVVVAVDLPSGLNADTGAMDPGTLAADLTVTLAFPKIGVFFFPGASFVGELEVGGIGLPDEMTIPPGPELMNAFLLRPELPARPLDSNKGTFGRVMVLAGSPAFIGAGYLSAAAAARIGAGLVTLATTSELARVYAASLHEVTYHLMPPFDTPAQERATSLLDGLAGYRSLVVGPGLGQAQTTREMLAIVFKGIAAMSEAQRPTLLVDADGLNNLAKQDRWWELLPPRTVLTPHPGEIARLLGGKEVSGGGIDRLSIVLEAAKSWGHIVVLKGGVTLVADPDGRLRINWPPNPALASAGTGDVLSGAIGGLLAQGMDPFEAASAGVYLHSRAGLLVAERLGDAGLLASDLLPELPLALQESKS